MKLNLTPDGDGAFEFDYGYGRPDPLLWSGSTGEEYFVEIDGVVYVVNEFRAHYRAMQKNAALAPALRSMNQQLDTTNCELRRQLREEKAEHDDLKRALGNLAGLDVQKLAFEVQRLRNEVHELKHDKSELERELDQVRGDNSMTTWRDRALAAEKELRDLKTGATLFGRPFGEVSEIVMKSDIQATKLRNAELRLEERTEEVRRLQATLAIKNEAVRKAQEQLKLVVDYA